MKNKNRVSDRQKWKINLINQYAENKMIANPSVRAILRLYGRFNIRMK